MSKPVPLLVVHVESIWWSAGLLLETLISPFTFHPVTLPSQTQFCIDYKQRELNGVKYSCGHWSYKGRSRRFVWLWIYNSAHDHQSCSEMCIIERRRLILCIAKSRQWLNLIETLLSYYSLPNVFRNWSRLIVKNGIEHGVGYTVRE